MGAKLPGLSLVKSTVPVGEVRDPWISVTVAVHVVGLFTGTNIGRHVTEVVVVSRLELSKVPAWNDSGSGVVVPFAIVTQIPPETLLPPQPVANVIEIPLEPVVPVTL